MNSKIHPHLLILLCLAIGYSSLAQTSDIDSLERVLKTIPADTNRVNTLIALSKEGTIHTEKIFRFAHEALVLSQKIDFEKGEAEAYESLGYYYYQTGNSPQAIEFLLKGLRIWERKKDYSWMAACYNNIGLIYISQKETEEALHYFKKALALWSREGHKDNPGIVRALGNIASVYEEQKNDSLSMDYYNQSLKLATEIKDSLVMGSSLNALGSFYLKRGEYHTSLQHQKKALQFAITTKNPILQSRVYNSLSKLYAAQGMHPEALSAAENALRNALIVNVKEDVANSYYSIYKAYEQLKNYPQAYAFQSLYIALHDSLKSSENISAMDRLRHTYALEKKETEIKVLVHRHEAEVFRRNTFLAALTGFLMISFLLYNRQRLIVKRKLASKKQQLDFYTQSLIEKSLIIDKISKELELLKGNPSNEDQQIEKFNRILQLNILTDEDWEKFKKAFEDVHPGFFARLRYQYPDITISELRLSALIKLKLSLKESATMLGISPESVKKSRYRLKKKFGLTDTESLEEWVNKISSWENTKAEAVKGALPESRLDGIYPSEKIDS